MGDILESYTEGVKLDFLTGRDEEIWMPLFCLARVFCPERLEELSRCAVDIARRRPPIPAAILSSKPTTAPWMTNTPVNCSWTSTPCF